MKKKGFTLAELLVVVVILGVAATIGIPMLHSALTGADLTAAATEVASALKYAQRASARTDRMCRVVIDDKADTLAVQQQVATNTDLVRNPSQIEWLRSVINLVSYRPMEHPLKHGSSYLVDFAHEHRFGGVDIATVSFGGSSWVSFDEFGTPSSGGTVVLVRQGQQANLVLDAASGKVTITY